MTVSELIEKLKMVEFIPRSDTSRDVYIQAEGTFTDDLIVLVDKDDDVIISDRSRL